MALTFSADRSKCKQFENYRLMCPWIDMQKNTKAILIFFSIFSAMIILLLVLIFINIESGNIKFFFKVYSNKPENTIHIKQIQDFHFRL